MEWVGKGSQKDRKGQERKGKDRKGQDRTGQDRTVKLPLFLGVLA